MRRAWIALAVINFIGALFGFYYYEYQFSVTSPLLWVFVPDCPLYVLFFAISAVLILQKRRVPWLEALAAAGCLKYGLWTVIAILLHADVFFNQANIQFYGLLWVAHIGMALESFLLFEKIKKPLFLRLVSWFVLNDLVDHFIGTLPFLPSLSYNSLLLGYSILASFVIPYYLLITKGNKFIKKY